MHIAIIGAGNLGGALARGWAARGHQVALGVRDPGRDDAVKGEIPPGVVVTTAREAIAGAEVVVIATPAPLMGEVLTPIADLLDNMIVIDATNPVGPGIQLMVGAAGESQAESMQAIVPNARVIKSFNQTGANNIPAPATVPRPVMFVAGNDGAACTLVAALAEELGFESVQAGALTRARELERLAILWISLAAAPNVGLGRNFSFGLLRS